jgi:hypothetical protein
MNSRIRRVVALACTAILLSGCQSPNIYNYSATRDDQGKRLEDSYGKWKLKSVFETAASNREKILAEQISALDKLSEVRRASYVRVLATEAEPKTDTVEKQLSWLSSVSGADSVIGQKLIGATPAERQKERLNRSTAIARWLKQYDSILALLPDNNTEIIEAFAKVNLSPPSCVDVHTSSKNLQAVEKWASANASTKEGAIFKPSLTALKSNCISSKAKENALASEPLPGLLKKVRARLVAEENEYITLKKATADDRATAEAALGVRAAALSAARTAADEKNTSAEATAVAKARVAAETAKGALDKLKMASDAFSVEFISDKGLDSLDEFLMALVDIKDGQPITSNADKAAVVLVLYPELVKKTQAELKEADAIGLAPVVMQKQLTKIAHDSASREISVREARIALLRKQEELVRKQLLAFVDIDFTLAGLPESLKKEFPKQYPESAGPALRSGLLEAPMAEILASKDGKILSRSGTTFPHDERAKVWTAAMTYIDEGTRRTQDIAAINLTLDQLAHQSRLSYSEANVMQWNTLVGVKVEQLALYGKAGLKPEQYAAFVNNLMLLWIGARIPQ